MRTLIRRATLAFALVAGVPVTNAQSPVTQQPYEAFIVQPSGTLVEHMPFVTIPEGVIQPVQVVQSIQPEHVAQPIARRRIVASHHLIVHHEATARSLRPLYDYVVLAPVVRRIVTPVLIAPAPAPQHVRAMSALPPKADTVGAGTVRKIFCPQPTDGGAIT